MLTIILTLLTVVSALIQNRAKYRGPRHHVYIFKPLTTILILLNALQLGWADPSLYKYAILAGLVSSLAGDVFLMLPSDRFRAGLISFLIAHIFYIVAFTSETGFSFSWLSLLPFAIYGVVMFAILAPHTGKMKLPMLAYVVVILIMAWQACARWGQTRGTGPLLAFLGAVLFVISDSVLALDRFRGKFKAARLLILVTYYSAQWLIAVSLGQGILF